MSALPEELLKPLRRFQPADDAVYVRVDPKEMPEAVRGLLVHAGDMTSRLESFHKNSISLKVCQTLSPSDHEEGAYSREVMLINSASGAAVEYGAIEIFLNVFTPALRALIIEGRVPLGGLLNRHGVRYRSEPQAYFRVSGTHLSPLLGARGEEVLFGRCNVLRTESGELLARIVEVLPPLPSVSERTALFSQKKVDDAAVTRAGSAESTAFAFLALKNGGVTHCLIGGGDEKRFNNVFACVVGLALHLGAVFRGLAPSTGGTA